MPWDSKWRGPCPCTQCAHKSPSANMVGHTTIANHKKWYGVANEEQASEGDEPLEMPSPPEENQEQQGRASPVPDHAEVDEKAFAMDLVLLIINHGVPWSAAEMVINLVNTHVVGRRLHEGLPASPYQLKRLTGCNPGDAKLFDVCPECDFVFNDGQDTCIACALPPSRGAKGGKKMLVNDVAVRIKQMFGNAELARALGYAANRKVGDGDVWDGRMLSNVPLGATHNHSEEIERCFV